MPLSEPTLSALQQLMAQEQELVAQVQATDDSAYFPQLKHPKQQKTQA